MQKGKFGKYGGVFSPETLIPALEELELAYFNIVKKDKEYITNQNRDFYSKSKPRF